MGRIRGGASLTTRVFGSSSRRREWIYYTVKSPQEISQALGQNKPVVFMFSADWNEPCKVMKGPFSFMARAKRLRAVFCLVDINRDELKDAVAQQFQVEALPTFVLFKDGSVQGRVVGAKVDDLETVIGSNI